MARLADGTRNRTVVHLTSRRLQRLERRMAVAEQTLQGAAARFDATTARLDQAVDVLVRLVRVVAAQNGRFNQTSARRSKSLDQVTARADRLTKAIVTARSADVRRFGQLERRLDALERRLLP